MEILDLIEAIAQRIQSLSYLRTENQQLKEALAAAENKVVALEDTIAALRAENQADDTQILDYQSKFSQLEASRTRLATLFQELSAF